MRYVYQDGADFYIYADSKGEELVRIVTAPFKVRDLNLTDAIKARDWFNENGYFKGSEEMTFIPFTSEGF